MDTETPLGCGVDRLQHTRAYQDLHKLHGVRGLHARYGIAIIRRLQVSMMCLPCMLCSSTCGSRDGLPTRELTRWLRIAKIQVIHPDERPTARPLEKLVTIALDATISDSRMRPRIDTNGEKEVRISTLGSACAAAGNALETGARVHQRLASLSLVSSTN